MVNTKPARIETYAPLILLAAILLATYLAYRPGLSGPFLFDDNLAIKSNQHLAMESLSLSALKEAALTGNTGLTGRPLSMVTFALNRYAGGLDTHGFKLTNALIHMANGVAVFVLNWMILVACRRRFAPALPDLHIKLMGVAAAGVWLLHPLNLGSVLYVVQRMNELATLFTLLGLIFYLWGRLRMDDRRPGMPLVVTGVVVFGGLALLSKENGALLPLFMLVMEAVLFRFETPAPRQRRGLMAFFAVTVALPALALGVALMIDSRWAMMGYLSRDFTLPERLMTEARVLWSYLYWTLFPFSGALGFFHDDYAVSRGLLSPWTTAAAIAGHVALLAAAVMLRRRAPLFALAVLFFYAGHVMESTIFPLELIFEHRNYLPIVPLLLAAVFYLYRLAQVVGRYRHAVYGGVVVVLMIMLGYATSVRAYQWNDDKRFALQQLRHHPRSPRVNYMIGGLLYTRMIHSKHPESDFKNARKFFSRATLLDKNFTGGLFGLVITYQAAKRTLPPQIIAMLEHRLKATPFISNNANWLRQLVMCQLQGTCRLSRVTMMSLFKATQDNPTNVGVNKAYTLTIISRYMAGLGDYPKAVKYAAAAQSLMPKNLDYRLDTVDLLITMGSYDRARRALDEVRRLDTLGAYGAGIAEQARRLPAANDNRSPRDAVK